MKIALIGYGRMGHAIERIALSRGHEVVARIDVDNQQDFDSPEFRSADIAIEFTTPATALANYRRCFERGVSVVSGTTAWGKPSDLAEEVKEAGVGFFWTSNFSIGVNIFFALNRYLAKVMEHFPQYHPSMLEVHHIHKLDHPSGTAVTLAEGIVSESSRISRWSEDECAADVLHVDHRRQGEVPGTHIIDWDSDVDSITITHTARSRDGFALGAVLAAEWSHGRRGILTMDEMMEGLLKQ